MVNKIKELCAALNLNYVEFSHKLGVTHGAISQIKTKNKISGRMITTICAVFPQVNKSWLETGKGEMLLADPPDSHQDNTIFITTRIPVLARCPAGFPEDVRDGVIEYLSLPDVPPRTCAIIVSGNSMSPAIKDGEYALFVETDGIHDGDVVIAKNEWNECMVKRYRVKDGKSLLTSDNPEYPTVEPNEHYKIIGKVIEIVTRRKRF